MAEGVHPDPLPPSLSKRAKRGETQDVSNAMFVDRKIDDAKPVIGNEDFRRESQPDAEPSTIANVLTGPDETTTRVNLSHDAAGAKILDNGGEPEGTKLNDQEGRKKRDREFQLNDSLIEEFARKINEERCSLRNDAENMREAEQDLRIQLEGFRSNCDSLTNELEKERRSGECVRSDYFQFRKMTTKRLASLREENYKGLERLASLSEENKGLESSLKTTTKRLASLRKENYKGLESSLKTACESLEELEFSLQTAYGSLEEEKEKTLCQICFEAPKDALCQPCLHHHFCFPCLETYIEENKSCPSCRTGITGVTRLYS